MKKNLFFVAIATVALCMVSCQKDELNPTNNDVNTNTESGARVKSTSDLQNTSWICNLTFNQFLYFLGADTTCISGMSDETFGINMNFDDSLAHFTFSDNIEAYGMIDESEMGQIFGLSYNYSYDGTTHTGYFVCNAEDDNGNVTPVQLQFTYDDATDIITFNLQLYYADEEDPLNDTPVTFPLNFVRNE